MAEEKDTKGTSEGTEQNNAGSGTGDATLETSSGTGEGTAMGGSGDSAGETALGVNGEGGSAEGGASQNQEAVAPENYEEFKLPEGVEMSKENLDEFSALAKVSNLSQEAAQKFIDMASNSTVKASEALGKSFTDLKSELLAESMADGEIGGALFKENVDVALKAMDEFGTPALRKTLNDSGLGNHPEVIRAFFRIGKTIGEGNITEGGKSKAGTGEEKSFGDKLYGNKDK